jgi:hypothetical protein
MGEKPDTSPDLARQREIAEAFLAALRGGDFEDCSPYSTQTLPFCATIKAFVRSNP